MRVTAFVSPKSRPKIAATRSNSATATRPQLRPPTMSRTAASRSSFFIPVNLLSRYCPHAEPSTTCLERVQVLYGSKMQRGGTLRIGELSKRSGVSPELLRAWERRYGLLQPTRSAGGLRLYSADDLERVRQMRQHLASGLAAAEAAALVIRPAEGLEAARPVAESARADLADALDGFDESRAQAAI